MQTRRLGQADLAPLGLGAMSFAGFYGQATEDQAHATLDACRDAGVTHVDTSNVYGAGLSERMIGGYLAARPGPVPFFIATKGGITTDARGRRRFDNTPAHLEAELDGSLSRLGVERVDLYYVHRRDPDIPIEDVAGTLGRLVDKGKIGAIGFSEIAPSSLRCAAAEHPVAAVQSEYSLATRAPDLGLVQACAELGTAPVAFSPVGRGLLTDTPPDDARVAASAFLSANPRFQPPNLGANLRATDRLRALGAELDQPAAALAIAWVLSRGDHVHAIPGTRSAGHLAELVTGARAALTPETLARIEAALPVGWAHGDRYSDQQWQGPERFS